MIKIGDVLRERYCIEGEIGTGGIGVIFLAEDRNLRKKVVIKKIKENFVDRLEARAEVDILKKLRHTYLPQVYDFIQDGSEVYTVMDYIEGCDMQQYILQGIKVPEWQICRWMSQLLDVLDYLHNQSPAIYHCDIKPANIMVTPKGNVCLIDFNISLGDDDKTLKGISKWYSAPEQREAAFCPQKKIVLDARMDIYSLGASFYALMTGYYPDCDKESVWTPESRREYSGGLIAVIKKAMEHDCRKRFKSAQQMQRELQRKERWEDTQRLIWRARLIFYTCAALMMTCGICMTAYGIHQSGMERWQKRYRQFLSLDTSSGENAVDIENQGIELLNSKDGKRYMTGEEKGNILWQIGEGYYQYGDYRLAAEYYGDAEEYVDGDEQVYIDHAAALIQGGLFQEAEDYIAQMKKSGMVSEEWESLEASIRIRRQQASKKEG